MAFVLLTFSLVLGIIFGGFYLFVLRPETRDETALRKRLRGSIAPEQAGVGTLERSAERLSRVQALNVLLSRTSGISGPLERMITQSGLKVTVGTLLLASALLGCVTYLVVKWLTYYTYLGLAAAPFGAMVPFVFVRVARTKRLRLFEEQFPEAIELLARALRAGHAFPTGLIMVADEIPAPVGSEFKLVYDRQNFGMPLGDALKALAERVPVIDARFFVTAVLTQRETGGNLSEVLDNLASVIRDRFKVKRQVRVVTAHARITGWILAGLPPSLACVLSVVSPSHMKTLITDPLGIQMLAVAGVLQVSGTLIIRKLVNVRY